MSDREESREAMNHGIAVNDVVQIDPSEKHISTGFAGCFLLVTEVKSWGVMGFVAVPSGRGAMPKSAYYRVAFEEVALIGKAAWVPVSGDH